METNEYIINFFKFRQKIINFVNSEQNNRNYSLNGMDLMSVDFHYKLWKDYLDRNPNK